MQIIFVFGFPHSGTSVLRKLIGNCNDVHDVPLETEQLPAINILKNNVVIKATGSIFLPQFSEMIYKRKAKTHRSNFTTITAKTKGRKALHILSI